MKKLDITKTKKVRNPKITSKIQNNMEYEKVVDSAVNYYNKKDYKKSLKKLLQLAEYNYDNLKVHELLVYNYLHLKKFKEAENEFDLYVKLAKENNISLKLTSFDELIHDLGDKNTVKEKYEKVIAKDIKEINIADTKNVIDLGFIYMSQRKYEKAENILSNFKAILGVA